MAVQEKEVMLQELYDACNEDPQSLSAYVALTNALKSDPGKKHQLKEARFQFSQKSALPAKLWREWILDELRTQGGQGEDDDEEDEMSKERGFVVTLCTLALSDFQDIGVWLTYLEVTTGVSPVFGDDSDDDDDDSDDDEEEDDEEEELADTRAYFEDAIRSFGMHFSQGFKIWKMYLSFEMQQYRKLLKRGNASINEKIVASEVIMKLINRQLSLPLKDNNDMLQVARKFLSKVHSGGGEEVMIEKSMKAFENTHEKATKLRLKCEPYEAAIAAVSAFLNPKNSKLAAANVEEEEAQVAKAYKTVIQKWLDYISCLSKLQEVSLVLCCYERAVSQLSNQSEIWESYLNFTLYHLKDVKLSLEVARRATRNLPQRSDLHCEYLRLIEHHQEDITTTTDHDTDTSLPSFGEAVQFALNCKLGDVSAYFDVILAYCDYCRRRVSKLWSHQNSSGGDGSSREIQDIVTAVVNLRESFETGLSCLEQYGLQEEEGQGTEKNGKHSKIQSILQQRSLNKCKLKLFLYYIKTEENLICDIIKDASATYLTISSLFERLVQSKLGESDCIPWICYTEYESRQRRQDLGEAERKLFERAFDVFKNEDEDDEEDEEKSKEKFKKKNIKIQKENEKVKLIELLKLCESWLMFEREKGSLVTFEETKKLIHDTKQQVRQFKKANIDVDDLNSNETEEASLNHLQGDIAVGVNAKTLNVTKLKGITSQTVVEKNGKRKNISETKTLTQGKGKMKQVGVDGQYGEKEKESSEDGPVMKKNKVEGTKTTSTYEPMLFEKSAGDIHGSSNGNEANDDDVDEDVVDETLTEEEQAHLNKTLFITNLSFQVTQSDIETMFNSTSSSMTDGGIIEDVSLLLNKAGRFRGMSTVTFISAEVAAQELTRLGEHFMYQGRMISASRMTKQHLRKRNLRKKKDDEEEATTNSTDKTDSNELKKKTSNAPLIPYHAETIFVKGILEAWEANKVKDMFEEFGTVVEARILKDRFTKKSKCEALVQFESSSIVESLLSSSSPPESLLKQSATLTIEKSRFPAVLKSKAPPQGGQKKHNPYMTSNKKVVSAPAPASASASSETSTSKPKAPKKAGSVFSFIPRTLRKP